MQGSLQPKHTFTDATAAHPLQLVKGSSKIPELGFQETERGSGSLPQLLALQRGLYTGGTPLPFVAPPLSISTTALPSGGDCLKASPGPPIYSCSGWGQPRPRCPPPWPPPPQDGRTLSHRGLGLLTSSCSREQTSRRFELATVMTGCVVPSTWRGQLKDREGTPVSPAGVQSCPPAEHLALPAALSTGPAHSPPWAFPGSAVPQARVTPTHSLGRPC